jgi:gamma-glutamyltranspeptidase/glutathione hydrolase
VAAADHRPLVPAPLARGVRGAVVAPHHLATEAGIGILRAGGSAVDAAIATNAALSVVASYMCGLGGDAFWLIWDGTELHALNGSGRSAAAATPAAARAAGLDAMPLRGAWTVTVPGAIRSWGDAHGRFGRLAWPTLFEPAIELAGGFPASAPWIASVERSAYAYGERSDWASVFRPHGRAWRPGERVVLSALQQTLRAIAADGPDTAYSGDIAASTARYLEAAGSPLRGSDLSEHASDWVAPIATEYRGVTATSHPANSSGPIALELLNVLETFSAPDRAAFTAHGVTDAAWVHVGLEASRLTLGDRDAVLTDPTEMAAGAQERLLDREHARRLGASIDRERVAPRPPSTLPAGGGTIYLATADVQGSAVSLIESNYAGFGSGLVDPATGIAFQNRGAFFTLDPRHANVLAPRKRTLHTLTPGMLFRDGRPWVVHGSMGGEIQPQVFAQFVSALVDGAVDVATAVAAPRWAADVERHMGPPSLSVLEEPYPDDIAADLERRGHTVRRSGPFDSGMGHEHAIEIVRDESGDSYAAATDPRSEGLPATW